MALRLRCTPSYLCFLRTRLITSQQSSILDSAKPYLKNCSGVTRHLYWKKLTCMLKLSGATYQDKNDRLEELEVIQVNRVRVDSVVEEVLFDWLG